MINAVLYKNIVKANLLYHKLLAKTPYTDTDINMLSERARHKGMPEKRLYWSL